MLEKPSEIKMDRVEVPVGDMTAFDSYPVECPRFSRMEWTSKEDQELWRLRNVPGLCDTYYSERKDEFPLIDENRRSNGIKCNQRWKEDPYVLKENSRWFSDWRSSTNRKSSEHRSAANWTRKNRWGVSRLKVSIHRSSSQKTKSESFKRIHHDSPVPFIFLSWK